MCFSKELKAYLSADCSKGKCQALELLKKAKSVDQKNLPSDSRHTGSKICSELGASTLVAKSAEGNQLCVCIADDQSAISCQQLAL